MTGINLGTAFLQIVPSFEGSRRASEQAGEDMGRRAAEEFADRFSRDAQGRLRDDRGRFVREGDEIGQGMGGRAGEEFGEQFTRDAQGRLRDSRGRFVQEGERLGQGLGEGMQGPLGQSGEQGGGNFLGGLKGKAMAGIAGIGLAVGAAFMDAYTEATDVRQSKAKLQANLGLDSDAAAELGKTAGQLYAQGYGESISELTATVGEVFSSIQGLDIMDSATIEDLTGKAISFSQAFDTDVSESIQSVGTLMNSGLAKDAQNAFDLITRASQSVPAALRGNVLEASDEYSQFFRTLGFSGDEAFGALVKGAEKGEFGIDKTGDAIKEFTLLSTDMSENSVAAYQSIGLNAGDMANAILAGGDTAKGAFDQIVDGILAIQDPVAQSQAALALFGTPLEDMNVQDIPEFLQGLKGMSGGMGEVEGAADDMDSAMGSTTSGVELFWRGLKTKMVDYITDEVLPRITEFTAWLGEKLGPVIQVVGEWISTTLVPAIKRLVDWLGDKLVPVIQKAADFFVTVLIPAAQKAWQWFEQYLLPTIQRVGEFFGATIENLITVLGGFIDLIAGVFTGDWSRAWEGIKEIFGGIWDQIKNIFGTLWDVLVEFFTNLGPKLWEIVTGLAGQLVEWGGQFLGWIWQGIQDLWNGTIWPWFVGLPALAWAGIQAAAGWMVDRGAEFLSWVWNGITSKFEEVKAWFFSMPGWLWDQVAAGAGWVVDRGKDFLQWIWDGITAKFSEVQQWFLDLPATLWGAIQGAWSSATQWGGQLIKYIIDGISGSDPYIAAELSRTLIKAAESVVPGLGGLIDLTGVDIDKNIDDYLSSLTFSRNAANAAFQAAGRIIPGRATGGLFGPFDGRSGGQISVGTHGTADDVLIRGSRNEFMVNERATAENLPLLWHLNSGGHLEDFLPGFATGGLIGSMGTLLGASLVKAMLPGLMERVADSAANAATSAGGASNGQWGPGTDGSGLAANTAAARDFIMGKWGITDIGGVYGGSVPGSDHPIGKALDVMIANYLSAAGIAQGTSVADWFVQNPNAFGTKYVIWRDRINQGGTWAPYQHPSGNNDTLQHRDHVHLSFLTGAGQFSGGAQVPADDKPSGFLGSLVSALTSGFMTKIGGASPAAPGGVGGGVERWRPMAMQALTAVGGYLGRPLTQYIDAMLYQMQTESGGDPNALNTWDRNFPLYGGSGGLLQVIQPTFETALRGTPFANLIPRGKFDPWANMISSILYGEVTGPYHSLAKAYRGVAYDHGGMQYPGDIGFNFLNKPEAVLTPPETEAYQAHARALAAGFDSFEPKGGFTFTGDIHMGSGGPAEFFEEALWIARTAG